LKSIILILILNLSYDIDSVRNLFLEAYISKSNCDQFGKKINELKHDQSILLKGYEGCYYFIKCKFTNNSMDKFFYFRKGKKILESSIKQKPDSIELRFLRYTIQKNLPRFLFYYNHIDKDLIFVINNINSIKDKKTQQYIKKSLESINK
tara:strand:- start:224 stop:673 length:450 start_codon:yes stop_codon:yes gene_type:complete